MSDNEIKGLKTITKRALREDIISMAVLKCANKKQYGNIQISLKNTYLLGSNDYPNTIPDVLKVMNNYKPEWDPCADTHTKD